MCVNGSCRNNQILERHSSKVCEVIKVSLTTLEEDNAIHSAALQCVVEFPWGVS